MEGLSASPTIFAIILCAPWLTLSFPQQGLWNLKVDQKHNLVAVTKTVFSSSKLYLKVNCENVGVKDLNVSISFVVWVNPCYEEDVEMDDIYDKLLQLHAKPETFQLKGLVEPVSFYYLKSPQWIHKCENDIILESSGNFSFHKVDMKPTGDVANTIRSGIDNKEPIKTPKNGTGENKVPDSKDGENAKASNSKQKRDSDKKQNEVTAIKTGVATKPVNEKTQAPDLQKTVPVTKPKQPIKMPNSDYPQLVFQADGVHLVTVRIMPVKLDDNFTASVEIKIRGDYGYLSAVDWPLYPFYGTMCLFYVICGLAWLIISACQWRDLLRIQFWIGGVILLGMLEKAVFYAEYHSINTTGQSVQGAVMVAEVVSCLKRSLARMLVIIVSLGFGIVKPRLGPLLHRVVGVGALYFILSVVEAGMRVYRTRTDPYRQIMLAEILLAVLDSIISWWIFSSLVQTTRTLRLRRNIVKLSLYRHFTNTLIFAVLASIAFIIWSVRSHRMPLCVTDWKELWVDEAYWHMLFSVILLVIMILWRPTNNNQRYAFTPLLDAPDDEDEDEPVVNDAFEGMKLRGIKNQNNMSPKSKESQYKGEDDDLKWIEENIPSTVADAALPSLLDSDEEIMNRKFEMSKMN